MYQRRFTRFVAAVTVRLLLLLLLFSWSSVAMRQPVAYAHAFVIGSDPVDGSTVATVPKVVRIFFDSPISPASEASIYTPDERLVNVSHSTMPGSNTRELDTALLSPTSLPQGSYTVRWAALASIDGYISQGVIGFNVGQSSAGLPGETILGPSTSNTLPQLNLMGVLAVAWNWLVLVALTFWVGILVSESFILHGFARAASLLGGARKQVLPLQWLCLTGLLAGELITLILRSTQLAQATGGGGISPGALAQVLTSTTYGYLLCVRLACILGAMGLLRWSTQRGARVRAYRQASQPLGRLGRLRQRVIQEQSQSKAELAGGPPPAAPTGFQRYSVLWLGLAGLIMLTLALSGDSVKLAQTPVSAIVLSWLYLTARSILLGCLAYLGYVLLPLLPTLEPDHNREVLTTLLRRYQPLVLGSVGVLLVSGLFEAESSLSNLQQLVGDPYGRIVLLQSVLFVFVILLSGFVLIVLRPRLTRQTALLPVVDAELPARRARQSALAQTAHALKRVLVSASCLGAAVLLCAALMAFYAPPIVFPDIQYNASPAQTSPAPGADAQTRQVGDLVISLQVLPGRVNSANTFLVTVLDSRSGQPVRDASVQMLINMQAMDMGTAHATLTQGNPVYSATLARAATFSMPGQWEIRLHILQRGQAALDVAFSVGVTGN